MQILEHALSAVCNLAAGSQGVKQHMCEAGLIEPLLTLLTSAFDRTLAQLAALALRNLSRNPRCRQEIMRLDGINALLEFLSEGLENLQYPLHCEVQLLGTLRFSRYLRCVGCCTQVQGAAHTENGQKCLHCRLL
jgi:hypothetical protein